MGHWHGKCVSAISAPVASRRAIFAVQAFAAALFLYCGLSIVDAANAQSVTPQAAAGAILADGDAVVTGFSGVTQVPGTAAESGRPDVHRRQRPLGARRRSAGPGRAAPGPAVDRPETVHPHREPDRPGIRRRARRRQPAQRLSRGDLGLRLADRRAGGRRLCAARQAWAAPARASCRACSGRLRFRAGRDRSGASTASPGKSACSPMSC